MTVVNFIIGVIALIVAVLAYQRVGGVNDIKEQVKALRSDLEEIGYFEWSCLRLGDRG